MPDSIITSETSTKSADLNSGTRIICRVCEKQFSQYTCPRCNIRYCSLPCYKSHSIRCTESFMRENVMGELQQLQPDEESKSKMLDILKRFHEEEEADYMEEEETESSLSQETIQKILSGGQISLDDLSPEDQKYFQRAVASGELSKLIQPWDPWWLKPSAKYISLSPDGSQLVQPIDKEDFTTTSQNGNDQPCDIPPGPATPLTPLRELTASSPSPLLPFHLIDIIYSYCFTIRLYNGDWVSDPLESATVLMSVSSVLGQAGLPETVFGALFHCLEVTCSPEYRDMGGLQLGLRVIDDVISLLQLGGPALVCSLCDMQRLIQAAAGNVLKCREMHKSRKVELKSKLKFADRKVYFMMCWVHEQPLEAWSSLAGIVESEKYSAMEHAKGKRENKRFEKVRERGGKPLIREVHAHLL